MTVYRMHFRLNNIWMKNSIIVKVLIFGTSIIVILVLIIGFERANNYFQVGTPGIVRTRRKSLVGVDFAQYEIFHAKFVISDKGSMICQNCKTP